MDDNANSIRSQIECLLFISGEAVSIKEIQTALMMTDVEIRMLLYNMQEDYIKRNAGIRLFMTDNTVQLVTNPECITFVERFYQPPQEKAISQSMMETLAIVAYKQPVTRGDIESIRGVRCEYAVSQLLKQGLIRETGRRDTVGRPMEFGTADAVLTLIGSHSLRELPEYDGDLTIDESIADVDESNESFEEISKQEI